MKVAFQTNASLLTEEYLKDEEDSGDSGKKIEIKDNLLVEFNNGAQQV